MRSAAYAVAAIGIQCLAFASALSAQVRRPNIVVIVADDMGYADIGVHGSKDIPTPNIDALAASGIRFTDAYVSGPYCGPTRAGLMTGRYPQRFGQEFNIGMVAAHRDVGLPLEERTMADHLKAAGYRTALFGKWHLGSAPRFFPTRRGFDEFYGFLAGAHSYVNVGAQGNPIFDGNEVAKSVAYLTDTLGSRAVEFITRNSAQPFFLYLAFNAVHTPLHTTEKYRVRFAHIPNEPRRTYAAMLSAMDDAIGRTLAALRAQRLEENTLIFFFSDNGGPVAGNGANGSSNGPLRGQKTQTWEGGIRVPFIVSWKGTLPAGKTDSRPIIQLDVLPTALAAAGIPTKPEWKLDGVNLLPFLTGSQSGEPHDALYWRLGGIMAVRKGDWKLVKMYQGGANDDPATITLNGAELFNLRNDMSEKNNVAAAHPDKVSELADAWQRWKDQLVRPRWEPPQGYGDTPRGCLEQSDKPLADYAGTWRGAFGAVVTWIWEQRGDSLGSITFANEPTPIPTRILFASSDSAVFDVTQPVRTGRPGFELLTFRLIVSVCGDELTGFAQARKPTGSVERFPFSASRSPSR